METQFSALLTIAFHGFLISHDAVDDRPCHLLSVAGIKNLSPLRWMRHEAGFDQDRRHRCLAKHGKPGPAHAAIFSPQASRERLLNFISQKEIFVVEPISRERPSATAFTTGIGRTGPGGR